MKHEYHEGPEALARFDKGMAALFRAPKPGTKPVTKKPAHKVKKATKARRGSTAQEGEQK